MHVLNLNIRDLTPFDKVIRAISNPEPSSEDTIAAIEFIVKNGLHYGHSRRFRKIDPSVLSGRLDYLDIINPEIILASLREFFSLINKISSKNSKVMFYIYKAPLVDEFASLLKSHNAFFLTTKWIRGTLTNITSTSLHYMKKYGVRVNFIPEYLINLSNVYTDLIARECSHTDAKLISLIDTNNFMKATYPIIINDDSYYSYYLILEILRVALIKNNPSNRETN